MKKQPQHKSFGQGLAAALSLTLSISTVPMSVQAATWNCANDFWDIASCWDTAIVPTSNDNVSVYTVGGADTLLKIGNATGNAYANSIYMNATTGTTVTLQQTGGNLFTVYEIIGNSGTGTFTQSGGSNTLRGALTLGLNSMANGSYNLSGTGVLSALEQFIGRSGTGTFTQSGGSNTLSALYLGRTSTGNGSYNLSGTGSLSASNEFIGNYGTGTFTQSGGTNTLTQNLYLGYISTGNGSYNLSGTGSLSASNEFIGYNSTGTFTQSGGTNTLTNNLYLGYTSTGNGNYTILGGSLDVGGSLYLGGGVSGSGGTASMVIGGYADVIVANETFLYEGSTLQMNGGTLVTAQLNGSGSSNATFNSGSLTATNSGLVVGVGEIFGDQLILGNAASSFSIALGLDTSIKSGATLTLNSNSSLTTNAFTNEGMVSGFGSVNGMVNGGASSVFIASGGTLALGNASSFNGFRTQGLIDVGTDAVTLKSRQFAQLGYQTNLGGGTLNAENGVFLSGANAIVGFGNVNASVAAQIGSTISASGDLALGDTSKFDGYYSQGNLETNENTVTINDRNEAVLGSLTTLGNTTGAGTLQSSNGLLLQQGNNLVGYGIVNGDFINQGYVAETSIPAADQIEFTGNVSGAGDYAGNILFSGTFTPGNSPALVSFENIAFSSGSILTMEIGGLLAGNEYDVLEGIAGSTATLAGTLNIELFDLGLGNGLFNPSLGDTFEILTAETIVGEFDLLTLAALGNGRVWKLDYLFDEIGTTDIVRLSVVSAVPVPPAVWLFGSGLIGLIAVARRCRS